MTTKISGKALFFSLVLGYSSCALSGDAPKEEAISLVGNIEAGEQRYNQTCVNCHGQAGKGVASYPKVSGNEIPDTIAKLETYREGIKIGPNSSLMIMMAKPLTDEEIADLAAYIKVATSN